MRLLFLAQALLLLQGCQVPLQPYRQQHPAIAIAPRAQAGTAVAPVTTDQDCVAATVPICLAFVEVDDMGELWDKGELDTALGVIRRANMEARADPVVLTFVHGWKNNAAQDNANVAGFEVVLRDLYTRLQGQRPVIGIYVGWRGNLIRPTWPAAQQFSYFNREAAATRIPGATLSSALTQIAMRTHENPRALAVFIGHSFGGLLLERVLSEATASQIAQAALYTQEADDLPADSAEAAEKRRLASAATDGRADLVIFINPAGAATEAKPMLNFLVNNSYRYQPFTTGGTSTGAVSSYTANAADRPLFVSLTSTGDLATKVAVPIGHALPVLGFKAAGSFRDLGHGPNGNYGLSCYDPHEPHPHWELRTKEEGALPQSSFYLNTAPHMQVLQSHLMLKAIGATQMQVASTGQKITIHNPAAIAECNRDLLNAEHLNIVSTFRLADTQVCFAIQERPHRCNGTPYWMMEIDPDVVPDHGTIFTERFIQFLMDTFFTAPQGAPMQRISPGIF
jgi:hypothetical protein